MKVYVEQIIENLPDGTTRPGAYSWVAESEDFSLVSQGGTKNEAVEALTKLILHQLYAEKRVAREEDQTVFSVIHMSVPMDGAVPLNPDNEDSGTEDPATTTNVVGNA